MHPLLGLGVVSVRLVPVAPYAKCVKFSDATVSTGQGSICKALYQEPSESCNHLLSFIVPVGTGACGTETFTPELRQNQIIS